MSDGIVLPDGYTDIPAGKIAAIATSLEMRSPAAARPVDAGRAFEIRQVARPDVHWYRDIYRRVGEPWLWQQRLRRDAASLEAIIRHPLVEIWTIRDDGRDEALLELDFRQEATCELVFFGVTQGLIGRGAGRQLMNHAIARAFARPIGRFWLHTCTLDHPGALGFYIRSGFRPFARKLEIADDPRLDGTLAPDAAPWLPIIP